MQKSLTVTMALLLGFLVLFISGSSFAQETGTEAFAYGTVESISADRIVITEYDYDKDEEVDVAYIIDAKTELTNVNGIQEIKEGDNADIVYAIINDERVARTISIEKPESDGGSTEGQEPESPAMPELPPTQTTPSDKT